MEVSTTVNPVDPSKRADTSNTTTDLSDNDMLTREQLNAANYVTALHSGVRALFLFSHYSSIYFVSQLF